MSEFESSLVWLQNSYPTHIFPEQGMRVELGSTNVASHTLKLLCALYMLCCFPCVSAEDSPHVHFLVQCVVPQRSESLL